MKKLSVLSIVFIMIVTMNTNLSTIQTHASQLNDINGHWAKPYIQELVDMKAINGYPDGSFKPNANISRAAFVTVLIKAMDLELGSDSYFFDTDNHWAEPYIASAVESGIVRVEDYGIEEGLFRSFNFSPDKMITREEMAQMITRALGKEYSAIGINSVKYNDSGEVSPSLIGYVAEASSHGIITGYPNGNFGPKANATRAEASVMITRLLSQLDNNDEKPHMESEDIYELYSLATVKISGKDEDGQWYELGSGFIISSDGKVVTNSHVITGSLELKVEFCDGSSKNVESVFNYDWSYDVAVLNLEAGNYNTVPIGSSRNIKIGSKLYAIGYPLVQNLSISDGIISSTYYEDGIEFIQLSAPISPGSSGGALVNKYGEVIGITTAFFYSGQNVNLAIPISNVIRYISGENYNIPVDEACSTELDFTDEVIGGHVTSLECFFSNDLEMTDVTYDTAVSNEDYNYIGFEFSLNHHQKMKKNAVLLTARLVDDYGDVVATEFFSQKLFASGMTNNSKVFSWFDLKDLGEGIYAVELYAGEELLGESEEIVVSSNMSYKDYGPITTTVKLFDYDSYELTYDTTRDKKFINEFKRNSFSAIGYQITGTFSKSNDKTYDQYILYRIEIEKDGEVIGTHEVGARLSPGEKSAGLVSGYGSDPGQYDVGEYDVKLYYKDELLDSAKFTIVEGSENITQKQKLSISKIKTFGDDLIVEQPRIDERYDLTVPIRLGVIKKNSILDIDYKVRSSNENTPVDTVRNNMVEYIIGPENTGELFEVELTIVGIESDYRLDYLNGEDLFIDVYVDGILIDSILYEPLMPKGNYEVIDAILLADNIEKHWFYDGVPFEEYKMNEVETIHMNENGYLHFVYNVEGELDSHGYRVLVDYIYAELVNDDTGEVVADYEMVYDYTSSDYNVGSDVLIQEFNFSGIATGMYIINVYIDRSEDIVLSKKYVIAE